MSAIAQLGLAPSLVATSRTARGSRPHSCTISSTLGRSSRTRSSPTMLVNSAVAASYGSTSRL